MGKMENATVEEILQKTQDFLTPGGMLSILFQGGEPTMIGLPFFREFVQKTRVLQSSKIQVSFSIQTNGILLDEEWVRFFKQEQFLVGLSVDGCPDIHDDLRVDPQGKGTWARVLEAKDLLLRYQVDYNVVCVVTDGCARQPARVYQQMKDLGTPYLQFIPCLDPMEQERGSQSWSLKPGKYGVFLCKLFDLWYQDLLKGRYYSIRLFDDYLHLLLGEPGSTCSTCGKCGSYLLVEGDGSCYPCDFFALDEWNLGNIREKSIPELLQGEKAREFLQRSIKKPEECGRCSYQPLCNGGCSNDWYRDENGNHNYFCASFQMFFEKKLPKLKEAARILSR